MIDSCDPIPRAIQNLFRQPCTVGADPARASVERYLRHEFDVLGSGWLRVGYGMQAPGFLGRNDSDLNMSWARLVSLMPAECQHAAAQNMELARSFVSGYEPIDWHIDIKSGHRSELRPAQQIAYGTMEGVDLKVTADLSRGYPLPQLGIAWRATGERRYWGEAVAQMLDWLAANPAGLGPGWRATMNVAIRAENWIATLGLLHDGFHLEQPSHREAWRLIQQSLIEHRRRIAAQLEFAEGHYHPNHYIANLVGLLLLCLCLDDTDDDALAWQRLAWRELRLEMRRQIGADGFDFEGATSYHAFVLEMLGVGLLLAARASGQCSAHHQRAWLARQLGDDQLAALHAMFAALRKLTPPSGLIPLIGDNDSGRLVCLETPQAGPRDWRFLGCVGASLFEDTALMPESVKPEHVSAAMWLVDDPPPTARPAPVQDAAFPHIGFYVLRGGGAYVLVSAGSIGTAGLGGHSHNDKLALTLEIEGREILVDPGVFVYTASLTQRNAARSVLAHNTVAVDGQEQNRWLDGSPWWGCHDDTQCRTLFWQPGQDTSMLLAEHSGYHSLTPPVTHRRALELRKHRRELVIHDSLLSASTASLPGMTWSFVLHPECKVQVAANVAQLRYDELKVRFQATQGDWTLEDGFYCPAYGRREATKILRQTFLPGIALQSFLIVW